MDAARVLTGRQMELMREIEKRVEMQIPTLTPNLGLPMEINLDG